MRAVAALLCVLPAIAFAQDKVELNKITRVEVKSGSVEITGSRTPNFNTFTMSDPPRLVIDISEAVFAGVPEVIPGQGVVTGVKTASYGSASAAIARVLVGFDRDVETDLSTSGNTVTVKVLGGAPSLAQREGGPTGTTGATGASGATGATGTTVAQVGPQDRGAQEKATAEAQKRAEEDRAAQEKAAREAAARAEEDRKREEAERQKAEDAARTEQQKAEAEAKQRSEAAQKAEDEKQRKATEEAAKKAEAERRKQEEAERKAAEEAQRRSEKESAEKAKREAEEQRKAQLAAEKEAARQAAEDKRKQAEEAKRAAEEAKKEAEAKRRQQLEDERAAKKRAEEERKQQLADQKRAQEEARKAAIEEKRKQEQEVREAKARAEEDRRRAAAEEKARHEQVASSGGPLPHATSGGGEKAVPGARRTLSFVGFRPVGHDSRVTIKTDGPVQYEIRETDPKTVVVVLANTHVGSHNAALFLDTSFFGTPVQRVNPTQVGGEVHVEITLKAPVPYQAKQDGGDLVLEFKAP